MTVLTSKEKEEIQHQFTLLLEKSPRLKKKTDRELVEKALSLANEAHKNMRRRSGEPYIFHPLSVARIVSEEIGLGSLSIICALLHDVVEDTDYTLEDIEYQFGEKAATIIDGLTKISGAFDNQTSTQAENFRKILLTLSDDVRVILIKLADRLHNMRTLHAMPAEKQLKIASETIFIYAPLAHRLGLHAIKTELEDLSLKYRHPQVYDEIAHKIREKEKSRIAEINRFSLPIIEALEKNHIQFDINGRPKSIYSVWKKMQTKNIPFEEVYDLLAIRIIFEPKPRISEKALCWNIYSLITDIYIPKPDRLRDWISKPKANGYEALHATVMGPSGKWVEVQIRSRRMDEIAERGYAAHWKYKGINAQVNELDVWLRKIRELLEDPNENALEFLDEFKLNLYSSEILVFTPKGHIKSLPKNASTLDFAYEIHSEIGNHAIGAKVNHRLVPLSYKLSSGDQVEILTSDKQKPQREWLDYVNTVKAKVNIKKSLKTDTRSRIQTGKLKLESKLKELDIPLSARVFRKLLPAYEVLSKDELYSKIGLDLIDLSDIKKILKQKSKNKLVKYWELQFLRSKNTKEAEDNGEALQEKQKNQEKKTLVLHEDPDATESFYKIAPCCKPIPGDQVTGYQDPDTDQVIIHKSNCPVIVKLASEHGERIIPVRWTAHKVLSFLTRIKIVGIDRIGILNDITSVVSKVLNVNIRALNVDVDDGIFNATLDIYVHSTVHLNNLVYELAKIKSVEKVNREETIVE
ncbi:MAG: bifunctional (p)ppGpp synthetase/guanosine-3',5'-bis(diphosphate) 3'-pyrophosphohydrolase [Chlorobi bacterium]|nr:bifunctional (p)ppGpp synthetase/guanosine-3',5'-bis(diphosphate) 3'-pyrophosphohydrolase [Chlorobiota bacterium]